MGTLLTATDGFEMTDEGTKITLRMGLDEIQQMEAFIEEHDIGTRSDLIRAAIKEYISPKGSDDSGMDGSGIFIRFSEVQLEALANLVKLGVCIDEEEFVRKCVMDVLISPETLKESAEKALKTAQMSAALK